MNEQEMNKKLAEWAGWRQDGAMWATNPEEALKLPIKRNKNNWHTGLPPFTQSLDACFKWLVPKIGSLHYIALFTVRYADNEPKPLMWDCNLSLYDKLYNARAETPALALCNAILKLIEGEK